MLTGNKIILREFRESDIEKMHSWVNDQEITKYLAFAVFPRTLNDTKKFLDDQINRKSSSYVNFVICDISDTKQEYIGSVGLKNIDFINRKAELAIAIGVKEYFSKGFGSEAAKLIVDYAFNKLNLNKVYLHFVCFNDRGKKSFEKAGFKFVAYLKDDIFYDGNYYDQGYMEILKNKPLS